MSYHGVNQYVKGYNEGYTAGADMFSLHVMALASFFGLRIFLMAPPVKNFLADTTKIDLYNGINHGLDIVSFLVVAIMYWGLQTGQIVQ